MIDIHCDHCDKPLTGGLDTYGWPGNLCWDCYAEWNSQTVAGRAYYGLGPHHHDLSITGSIIGSTVLDPLPEPNADGEYIIDNQVFIPDPDAPGLGIWEYRPLPGWR